MIRRHMDNYRLQELNRGMTLTNRGARRNINEQFEGVR